MNKNGKMFISVIASHDLIAAVWDPYVYRHREENHPVLSEFVDIAKVTVKSHPPKRSPFQPIEYRDIPNGHYLSFILKPDPDGNTPGRRAPTIGEGQILFGTMRAYLGNILVTPLARWLGQDPPLYFPVKSEFVLVSPRDQLTYFWFAYMRSHHFLENLPIGTGGTRPRLQPQSLAQTPVQVPDREIRRQIHKDLEALAQKEWEHLVNTAAAIDQLKTALEG